MAGKNKIERGFRFTWNSQDLSGDLIPGTCTGGGMTLDEIDMTGVSNTIKQALGGYGDSRVTAQFHLNDTGTTGAHTVLSAGVGTSQTLTLQWGSSGAAPTTGDPEWEGTYTLISANVQMTGGRAVINAVLIPTAGAASDPAWGTV